MSAFRSFLVIFFLAACFSLKAFDACLCIDLKQAADLPGWLELRQHLYPDLAAEAENNLAGKGIKLALTDFSFLLEGDTFSMHLKGVSGLQLEYLLKQKMIHPDWSYRKENGIYHISGKDGDGISIRETEGGLQFANGTIKQKTLLNFKRQNSMIIQGVFLCEDKQDLNPALEDVSLIYLYLFQSGKNIITDLYIRGRDKAADKQILQDLNRYFSQIYARAAKDSVFHTDLLNIYQISENQGWVRLRITLSPEQAEIFFKQFGNELKSLLR